MGPSLRYDQMGTHQVQAVASIRDNGCLEIARIAKARLYHGWDRRVGSRAVTAAERDISVYIRGWGVLVSNSFTLHTRDVIGVGDKIGVRRKVGKHGDLPTSSNHNHRSAIPIRRGRRRRERQELADRDGLARLRRGRQHVRVEHAGREEVGLHGRVAARREVAVGVRRAGPGGQRGRGHELPAVEEVRDKLGRRAEARERDAVRDGLALALRGDFCREAVGLRT